MKAQEPIVKIGTRMRSGDSILTVLGIHRHDIKCVTQKGKTVTVMHSDIEKASHHIMRAI